MQNALYNDCASNQFTYLYSFMQNALHCEYTINQCFFFNIVLYS